MPSQFGAGKVRSRLTVCPGGRATWNERPMEKPHGPVTRACTVIVSIWFEQFVSDPDTVSGSPGGRIGGLAVTVRSAHGARAAIACGAANEGTQRVEAASSHRVISRMPIGRRMRHLPDEWLDRTRTGETGQPGWLVSSGCNSGP